MQIMENFELQCQLKSKDKEIEGLNDALKKKGTEMDSLKTQIAKS